MKTAPIAALAGLTLLAIVAVSPGAMAEEICGVIWSGNHPVAGAQVLASAEGVLATTDAEGRFCLDELGGKLQRIQIVALGYHPAELWAHVDAYRGDLRIDLVPLRTLQFGKAASGKIDGSFPPGPRLRQQTADAVALGRVADPVFLILAADSVWSDDPAVSPVSESLALLQETLTMDAPGQDSSEVTRYWADVADWARDLETRCCRDSTEKATTDCRTPIEICGFLDRAVVIALARGYLSGDEVVADELDRRLRELLGAANPELREWARMLVERLDLPAEERR